MSASAEGMVRLENVTSANFKVECEADQKQEGCFMSYVDAHVLVLPNVVLKIPACWALRLLREFSAPG